MIATTLENVPAAIHVDNIAGDVVILDQEDHSVDDVSRGTCALQESPFNSGTFLLVCVIFRKQHRTGTDRIDLNVRRIRLGQATIDSRGVGRYRRDFSQAGCELARTFLAKYRRELAPRPSGEASDAGGWPWGRPQRQGGAC